jgi:Ca2+-binding EF-hand superfamily protein
VGSGPSISNDLRSHHIVEVKEKFVSYDKDHSGQIGKEATLQLFMDLLPHFSANMLECFVNDEFPEADRDPNDSTNIL